MDPLSIAASLTGIIELTADTSSTVFTYCKSVHNAPANIQNMAQELAALRSVLEKLSSSILAGSIDSVSFEQTSALALSIQTCGTTLGNLSSKLQNLKGDVVSRTVERLKWPFSEKDMKKNAEFLQRCTATFQFSLTVEG